MNENLKEIRAELERWVPARHRRHHLVEIPKGEELFRQAGKESPAYPNLIRTLTKLYNILNQQLGVICQELGYPPHQSEWKNGRPLEVMRQIWRGIAVTNWYQWQLGQMLNEQDHPWVNIITTSDPWKELVFHELIDDQSTSKSGKSSPAGPTPPKP
ncbi:MAG: hypothetical protein ACE15F_21900 [bacterium]